jgi:hypothetical protein
MKRGGLVFAGALLIVLVAALAWHFTSSEPTAAPSAARPSGPYTVRSVLTLQDIEREAGVPIDHLVHELHLPENVPTNVPLRKLVTDLGLDMREVRRVVREYRTRND